MANKARQTVHSIPMHFHIVRDGYNNCVRLHRHGDPGDRFDMVPTEDFEVINKYMSYMIQDVTDDDDAGSCRFCHPNT